MKRAGIMAMLLFTATALRAQQQPPPPQPPPAPAPAVQPANDQQDQAILPTQPLAAPKTGHPLDPHDVDVLTGKADRDAQAPRATPYLNMNGSYGSGYMSFGRGNFVRTQRISPFLFGQQFGGFRGFLFRFR